MKKLLAVSLLGLVCCVSCSKDISMLEKETEAKPKMQTMMASNALTEHCIFNLLSCV